MPPHGWVHRYALLLKSGKLEANVDFDIKSVGDTPIGQVSPLRPTV